MQRDSRFYVKSLSGRVDDFGRVLTEIKHSSIYFLQRTGYITKEIVDSDSLKVKRTRSFLPRRKQI